MPGMLRPKSLLLALIVAGLSSGAQAYERQMYFSFGGGKSYWDDGDLFAGRNLDKEDEARMLNFGWYFSRNAGLEFGYRILGDFGYQAPFSGGFQDSVELSGNTIAFFQEVPVSEKVLFVPRLGLAALYYDQSFPSANDSPLGGVLGLGLQFAPIPNLAFELIAESYLYKLKGSTISIENNLPVVREESKTQSLTHTSAQVVIKF